MNGINERKDSKRIKIKNLFQDWLKLLIRPNQFFARVDSGEIRSWVFPMVLLSITFILYSIVQGAAVSRVNQTQITGWTLSAVVFSSLAAIWIAWLWVSGILSSFLILAGIRFPKAQPRVIVAWAMSPLLFRGLIRLIYTLITGLPIQNPGMSGFVNQTSGFLSIFIGQIMAQIDIYFIWKTVLFWIALKSIPSIRPAQRRFAFVITLINMITVLALINTVINFMQNI